MSAGVPDGLVIRGEALASMTELRDRGVGGAPLAGAVDAVYIDPPYNRGGRFAHYEDSVAHEAWIDMMRERLVAIRGLLAASGSVWVHIDDGEMAYCRVLLDEVFGRRNFVAQIVVEINPKGRQLDRFFATSHDYILVYARDIDRVAIEPGTEDGVDPRDFPHVGRDGVRYRLLPLRNTNKRFTPDTAATMHYPLWTDPATGVVSVEPFDGAIRVTPVFGDLTPAVWRWSRGTAAERAGELVGRVVKGRMGERVDVYQRDILGAGRRKKLRTVWSAGEVGSSDSAKLDHRRRFPGVPAFSTPKPEELLRRVVAAATPPGGLVLDCFAGSGTTGVAAHALGRRWILVEQEATTVADYIVPRIDAAVAEHGGAYRVEDLG